MPQLHRQGQSTLRSSTRNHPNVETLRADKRLDVLVKKQVTEHQHLISSHNKEMQVLREALLLASQKYESLWKRCEQEVEEFKTYTISHIATLREKIRHNENEIIEHKKTIESLHSQLNDFHINYSNKNDTKNLKKDVDSKIKEVTESHLITIQDLQKEVKILFNSLKDDFLKFKSNTENKFIEIMDQIEMNYNITKIDREGVLKEVRVYEKTIFILEKKIENIYTLIERISGKNDLGRELSHKPVL